MKDVIQEANEKRFKADKDGDKRDAIKLSDAWLDELMKHPYHSRKFQHVTYVGKPGTGVYLLRESAKVSKEIKNRRMVTLSKRLGAEEYKNDGNSSANQASAKFKKGPDGKPIHVQIGGAGKMDIVPAHRQ